MKRSSNQTTEWWEEKMGTVHAGQSPRVEVFVRSLAPPVGACQQQDSVLEQLQSFERQGLIDGVDISVWGKSICTDSTAAQTEPGRRFLDHLEEFSTWEARTESAVTMPFEEKTVSSSITNEQYTKIVLPRVCLTVYSGEQLELVLPCEINGDCYCVGDFIDSVKNLLPVEQEVGTSA